MSSQKTGNYKLHIWEPSDYFVRKEFNENFQKIDAELAKAVSSQSSSLSTVQKTLTSSLNTKVSMLTGSYEGDGAESHLIDVGHYPLVLVLVNSFGSTIHPDYPTHRDGGIVIRGGYTSSLIWLTDTGFGVSYSEKCGAISPNTLREVYEYIIFY